MSYPSYELGNSANFLMIYDETRTVTRTPDNRYVPLPAFEIPYLFSTPVLAIKAISTKAKAGWKYAGILTQRVQLGTSGSANTLPLAETQRRSLRLQRTELCIFPMLTAQYDLVHECPFWVEDMRLIIWEYVGPIIDNTNELVELARIDILRLEAKFDFHSQQ